MRSLLDALQEGRLVELPDNDKEKALEFLALLIEAVPDIGTKTDVVKGVIDREAEFNTGLGKGVACPHCRTPLNGELLCAVGWSPEGIENGAPDGKKVHLVVMYYVPDVQRNMYLKEVSGLAKAISGIDYIQTIADFHDIHTVRAKLLDWVSLAISSAVPDTKARMIKLEARAASLEAAAPEAAVTGSAGFGAAEVRIIPFHLILWQGGTLVLSQDKTLTDSLERAADLKRFFVEAKEFEASGYRIAVLSQSVYPPDRIEYEAVAISAK
jgi:nitrogen PTS system EIIA component